MSDVIKSTFRYLIIAGIVIFLTAGPASAFSIEGIEKGIMSQDKVGVLSQFKEDVRVQEKVWESDENYDFSQMERITIVGSQPEAEFTYRINEKKVIFIDTSTGNPRNWFWSFGDGTTSTQRSPTHFYTSHGTYTVTLMVSNSAGSSSQTRTLCLNQPPQADFQYSVDGTVVTFTDTSSGGPTSWSWTFGDGLTSTQQSPPHTYDSLGLYTVTLTVSNNAGSTSKTQTVNLNQPPRADFRYSMDGTLVTFTDTSTGGPAGWHWTFGDGSSATQRNPVHTYASAGTYTVTLTAAGSTGSSAVSKSVTLGDLPNACFEYSVNTMIVMFSDTSTGAVTRWSWNFGDGKVSAVRNPYHIYQFPGTYPVELTVTNTAGSSTVVREIIVTGMVYSEYPDVVVGDITTIPTSFVPGEVILIPMETINKGTAPATSFFNYFYLSRDMDYSLDDTLIGTQFIPSLTAGESITQTATLTIPSRVPEGLYYIVVIVDATDVVPESDENNVKSAAIPSLLTGKVAIIKIPMESPLSGQSTKAEYLRELLPG